MEELGVMREVRYGMHADGKRVGLHMTVHALSGSSDLFIPEDRVSSIVRSYEVMNVANLNSRICVVYVDPANKEMSFDRPFTL